MPALTTEVFLAQNKLLDSRLTTPRYVHYAYAAPAPATLGECKERAAWVRRRVLLAAGLLPAPERTPLRVRIFDRAVLDGCSVEKVSFESRPGFLVAGSLYRPLKWRGRRPAILAPHGHEVHGRFEHTELASIQGGCMMLARLGFVVFSLDMVGYNDSCQLEHRWPVETTRRALLRGVGLFGLHLWNNIRAVDFLCGLPDVDVHCLGATGGSGGGTQSYYLAAVDARIRVIVPVCMMSAHYQGGCPCEEPPLIHLGDISTVDVVASLAPRPVLLPSVTGDWTNQSPSHDVPAVRQIYAIFGAADRVANIHADAPHNYNRNTREHMYAWFRRWLMNDLKAGRRIAEPKFTPPTAEALRLFPEGKPPRGYRTGNALLRDLAAREDAPFADPPASAACLRALKTAWRKVYSDVLGATEPQEIVSVGRCMGRGSTQRLRLTARVLGRYGRGEQTPALWVEPRGADANSPAALAVCGNGKSELFRNGAPSPLLSALLNAGFRVLAIDLLGKGEMAPLFEKVREDLKDPIFYAFNRSLTAHRVQEILLALAALRQYDGVRRPAIVATGVGAVLALLARPLAGDLRATAVDLHGCNVGDDAFWLGEMCHPLIRKVGDVRGAVALAPDSPLLLAGADAALCRWSRAVYQLQGKRKRLRLLPGALVPRVVASWL